MKQVFGIALNSWIPKLNLVFNRQIANANIIFPFSSPSYSGLHFSNVTYKEVIKREVVHKDTNKDYLHEAKPRANDHFAC